MSEAMAAGALTAGGASRPRYALIDAFRGLAIIGVVIYHCFWDLSYLWLIPIDVSIHPAWVVFARTLLGSFIFLTGVSLALAHAEGIRWRAFWRRFAIVGGAALLVTIGTLIAFPETFVYFGVLHAIALFSLLGLPFLRAPLWLVFLVGIAVLVAPLLYTHPIFSQPHWSWIGFWLIPPPTNDLVPVFPWFGLTLLGIGLTRLEMTFGAAHLLGAWTANGPIGRTLVRAGRWSLVIYLVHQLVLLAILWPIASFALPQTTSVNAFNRTCETGCTNTGADPGYCTTYCACALAEVDSRNLWDAVETETPTPEQTEAVNDVVLQCSGVPQDLIAPD